MLNPRFLGNDEQVVVSQVSLPEVYLSPVSLLDLDIDLDIIGLSILSILLINILILILS